MVLIGAEKGDSSNFALEWNILQKDNQQTHQVFPPEKIKYSPYSLHAKLGFHTAGLIAIYHRDLLEQQKSAQQEDISLLHRAKAYIYANFRNEEINIQRIADALLTSERTLYGIFKDHGLTVNSAIQTIRNLPKPAHSGSPR